MSNLTIVLKTTESKNAILYGMKFLFCFHNIKVKIYIFLQRKYSIEIFVCTINVHVFCFINVLL